LRDALDFPDPDGPSIATTSVARVCRASAKESLPVRCWTGRSDVRSAAKPELGEASLSVTAADRLD
jgi:hypothetical protein